MDEDQSTAHTSMFETIRRDNPGYGNYWYARDLSRYGDYLVVQNADPRKPIVTLGQTYFAV